AAVGDSAGMACSLIGLRLAPPWMVAVSNGDCRLYRYRRGYDPATHAAVDAMGGELRRLTVDDVLSLEMLKSGAAFEEMTEIERTHPTVITRVVGWPSEVEAVKVEYFRLMSHDLYLLCSDGVTRQLDDITIRDIISNDEEGLADRCELLVQTADKRS